MRAKAAGVPGERIVFSGVGKTRAEMRQVIEGVATAKRIEPLPDVPTFDEQGFKNLEVDNWFGIVAPAHTPKETIAQISGWLQAALKEPEVKAKLALQGLYPVGQCGDEFASYVSRRFGEYGEMIKESNIKAE